MRVERLQHQASACPTAPAAADALSHLSGMFTVNGRKAAGL
jgi:hypothetical protein